MRCKYRPRSSAEHERCAEDVRDLGGITTSCLHDDRQPAISFTYLNLIHTATPDTTRLSRLPVDRHRRNAGQAGSYT